MVKKKEKGGIQQLGKGSQANGLGFDKDLLMQQVGKDGRGGTEIRFKNKYTRGNLPTLAGPRKKKRTA